MPDDADKASLPETVEDDSAQDTAAPEPPRPRRPWLRLRVVFIMLLFAGVACYAAWRYAMSPENVSALLQGALAPHLNGRIAAASVRFDPFEGLVIDDVKLFEGTGDNARVAAEARRVVVAHRFSALFAGKFVVTGIEVLDAVLYVREGRDGKWNVANLIRTTKGEDPFPAIEDGIWVDKATVKVVSNSIFDDDDERTFRGVSVHLRPLGFSLDQWTFDGDMRDPQWLDCKVTGRFDVGSESVELTVDAPNVELAPEYLARFPKVGAAIAADYRPAGRVDLRADVSHHASRSNPWRYKVEAEFHNASATPVQWPVQVDNINGRVIVFNDVVILRDLAGFVRAGDYVAAPRVNGIVELNDDAGMLQLEVKDLALNEETIRTAPVFGTELWKYFKVAGLLTGEATLNLAKGEDGGVAFNSTAELRNCAVVFRAFPIPFESITTRVEVTPKHVKTIDLSGRLCGGRIETGSLEIDLQSSPITYKLSLHLEDVNLNDLVREASKAMGSPSGTRNTYEGLLSADIKLEGKGDDETSFVMDGHATINQAYIWNAPTLAGILRVLDIAQPKRVANQEGSLVCRIKNRQVQVQHAIITNGAIELSGKGTIGFDRTVDLEVAVGLDPSRFDIPILTDAVTMIVGTATRRIRKVHVTGTLTEPQVRLQAFKPIRRTISSMMELLQFGNSKQDKPKAPAPDKAPAEKPAKKAPSLLERLNPFE